VTAGGQQEWVPYHAQRYVSWAYDGLGRLKTETFSGVVDTQEGTLTYDGTAGYGDVSGYDEVGNRRGLSSTVAGISSGSWGYLANDWISGDSTDLNGNTIGQAGHSYTYDVENRLVTKDGTAVVIVYNGDGQRVKKTVGSTTTWYLVDEQTPTGWPQVVEEQTAAGVPNVVYLYGTRIISHRQGGVTYYYAHDVQGSTRAVYPASGTRAGAYSYDAFGNLMDSDNMGGASLAIRHLYNGEEWDADLGMYYLRARYYNPVTGRFLTMDTHPGSPDDPLSLHKYLYTANDPVNKVDPSCYVFFSDRMLSQTVVIAV
jgi:RHS repeat-associated protein